ncbi:MAG: hypothetical protein V1893_01225 [Candidatus Omnitrophota bacterium]
MNIAKTKSLRNIEQKMEELDEHSLRYQILQNAKNFKTSWIELGKALYSVWKDKLYKEWGYSAFETYTAREIGIRKETAMKLLRSYYFLEQEEPEYLAMNHAQPLEVSKLPHYESVYVLRQAKNKKAIDEKDYTALKKGIFEQGKDAREIKRDLSALIREREELEPEEEWKKKRLMTVKRFLGILRSLKEEIEVSKLLPAAIVKEVTNLIDKLEAEISKR